jgi:hypothetical protein
MTGDERALRGDETDVERARAELVAALTELEDKVNVPKRIKRFRAAEPTKFLEIVTGAGVAAAGLIALVVVGMIRRR